MEGFRKGSVRKDLGKGSVRREVKCMEGLRKGVYGKCVKGFRKGL